MSNMQLAEMAVQSLNRKDREELIKKLTGVKDESRIISRKAFASRAGRSERWVDQLAERGVIRKINIPGSSRAVGFLESEVEALLSGRVPSGGK